MINFQNSLLCTVSHYPAGIRALGHLEEYRTNFGLTIIRNENTFFFFYIYIAKLSKLTSELRFQYYIKLSHTNHISNVIIIIM